MRSLATLTLQGTDQRHPVAANRLKSSYSLPQNMPADARVKPSALGVYCGDVPTGSRCYIPGPGVLCYTLAYIRSACSVPYWITLNSLLFPLQRTVNVWHPVR